MIPYLVVKNPVGRRKLHSRINFRGLPLAIENNKSSSRLWYNPDDGTNGVTHMGAHYGYVVGTEAEDGDGCDIFLGPDREAPMVYIINQNKAPDFTQHDEQKTMLAYSSAAAAKEAYCKHYSCPEFFGSMVEMPFDEYKDKVFSHKGRMIKSFVSATSYINAHGKLVTKKGYIDKRTPAGAFTDLTDKKAKVEIDDSKAKIKWDKVTTPSAGGSFETDEGTVLGDLLDHAELFSVHPWLKKIKTSIAYGGKLMKIGVFKSGKKIEDSITIQGPTKENVLSSLLHEVQHAIQDYEGFSRGGSPTDYLTGREQYRRLAGEEEARRVSARSDMKEKDRVGRPYDRSDIKHSDLIFQKSHIQSYTRTTASGKTVFVGQYDDKRRVYTPDNSTRKDPKGNEPVTAPSGRDNFGSIQGEVAMKAGLPPGPIKLLSGQQFGDHKGFGKAHMFEQHGAEIRAAGFKDEEAFVADVLKNYSAIYDVGGGRYALVSDGAKQKIHILEMDRRGQPPFYSIVTGYITDRPKFNERNFRLLWKKGGSPLRKGGEEMCKWVGDKLGVDWKKVDLDEFCDGMFDEEDHKHILDKDKIPDSEQIAQIVLDHLKEDPKYYSKLKAAGLSKSITEKDRCPWLQ